MSDMLDYLRAFGQTPFSARPFNAVDNLVLAQLSYLDYSGAAEKMPCALNKLDSGVTFGVMEKDNKALFSLAAGSARFGGSTALGYADVFSKEHTSQFAAVCFRLVDGSAYVSFRGTDSTLVGWKEDFMLSFTTPVPAQVLAAEYLSRVGRALGCPLRVGGHSKGGNLAIYAAAFCSRPVQDDIVAVYSNDGPGFEKRVLESEEYLRIKPRIRRFIPESSAVGILMDSDSEVCIVKSSAFGLGQHNPYSWQTAGEGFVTCSETSMSSEIISLSQRDWFKCLSEDKRRQYTDMLFDILSAGNARTLRDIRRDPGQLVSAVRAVMNLPAEDRANLTEFVKQVFSSLYAGGSAAVKRKYASMVDFIKLKLGRPDE